MKKSLISPRCLLVILLAAFVTAPPLGAQQAAPVQPPSPPPATRPVPSPSVAIDPTRPEQPPGMVTTFAPVVDKVTPSVVSIHTSRAMRVPRAWREFFGAPGGGGGGVAQGLGSGVIVSPDGYILTNNHVTQGADEVLVTIGADRKEYKARRVGGDPGTDLAVLKIDADNLPAITFADSDKARVGDIVLAVGNPFGLTQTVTMGIISAVGRTGMGIIDYENFIQTDASVNPGNSGGALVDTGGRLLGINTAIFSRSGGNQGIGFAIPANLALQVWQSIREKGRVVRGYLGTVIQPVTPEMAGMFKLKDASGALVSDVTPKSPAEKAGIRSGDVILAVNGRNVPGPRELRLAIGSLLPGTKATLKVSRDGEEREVPVELGELQPEQEPLSSSEPRGPEAAPSAFPTIFDGIRVGDLTSERRESLQAPADLTGVAIVEISPDSAGYRAGLREGFVIQEIDRQPVGNVAEAVELSRKAKADKPVLLRVWSGGQSQYLTVEPK